MSADRVWTLVGLEIRQRVRSFAWYVLLGVFAFVLLVVTWLSFLAFSWTGVTGAGVYSTVVFVVLLLVLLVSPTIAGNAINGDREQATLAAVQVTQATTAEIVLGKLIAAWVNGLAFVVVAAPFVAIAVAAGGVSPVAFVVSILILVVEIGVVAAVGVGLSGLIARPLFSIATTYLVVAGLVVGTLIAFGLGGASIRTEVTSSYRSIEGWTGDGGADLECSEWRTDTYAVSRFDRVWWLLTANPFVILADATPTTYDAYGNPVDLFGQVAVGVRGAQIPPETEVRWDDCAPRYEEPARETAEQIMARTTPSWFVGLLLQLVLAAGLLWGAWARTRTPARRLPPGTRVA